MNKNCKMTIGAMLLLTTAFSAFSANAQTCAVPPTCESLGYDKSADECVDKAVLKCPFDENKIFCSNGIADGVAAEDYSGGSGPNGSYLVGDILKCKGTPIGYVIEVNNDGSAGRISSLDYENDGEAYGKAGGIAYCKTKTSCNLTWELTRNKQELANICTAKGVSINHTWLQSESNMYFTSSSCGLSSSTVTGKTEIFCTASFVSDKSSGGEITTTYNVGDTYVKDGVALGTIVSVDSTGQHGVLALSKGSASNKTEASALCNDMTIGGLNWGLATADQGCKIAPNGDLYTTTCSAWTSCYNNSFSGCYNTEKDYGVVCSAPF